MSEQREEAKHAIDAVRAARGYALPLHTVLAVEDPDALAAYERMMDAVYLSARRLDGKTKELVYVAALVALGAASEHLRAHMERAVREGATAEDILETLELLIPAAGVAKASTAFEVWRRAFRPASREPTA